jgi:hypothetical protein
VNGGASNIMVITTPGRRQLIKERNATIDLEPEARDSGHSDSLLIPL